MTRAAGQLTRLLILVLTVGCVPALRDPPSLEELSRVAGRHRPDEVDGLLDAARRAYDLQTRESVVEARLRWLAAAGADRRRVEGLIGVARADVWLSDHESDSTKREEAAVSGVQAAQLCREAAPEEPACAYWLAVAVGVQARERRSTALDALPRMVELLEEVIESSPGLEHAGPHRVLALVLLRAPGWPTGPGDPDRGLEHARRAVEIAPGYPPNLLCLGEALEAAGETPESRRAYEKAMELASRDVESGRREAGDWMNQAEKALGIGHPE